MREKLTLYGTLFIVGFFVYIGIEIVFTSITELSPIGHTSPWMGIVGGVSFICMGLLNEKNNWHLFLSCIVASLICTTIELIAGIIFNVWLEYGIWDYSCIPFNFMGQICLLYSFFWFVLSIFAFWLDDTVRWMLYKTGLTMERRYFYSLWSLFRKLFKKNV